MGVDIFKDVAAFEQIFEALAKKDFEHLRENFGRLQGYEVVPKLFEDSTHHIFKLFFSESPVPLICKLCLPMSLQSDFLDESGASLSASETFWSRIRQLFEFDACESLEYAQTHYQWMQQHTTFYIAKLYGLAKCSEPFECGYLLQEYIEGINCHRAFYTKERAQKLADHLMAMHQHHFQDFGVLAEVLKAQKEEGRGAQLERQSAKRWWGQIEKVIQTLPDGKVPVADKKQALQAIQALKESRLEFVPQLVDFRWDQIRSGVPSSNSMGLDCSRCYLLDLDALVIAPIEFEWVMLELVLSPKDMTCLLGYYRQGMTKPFIRNQRLVYRMVFYSMNLLGEMSWEAFNHQPKLLD